MSLTRLLDPECLKALEVAKAALPEGRRLDVEALLCALFHATGLKERADLKELAAALAPPVPPAGKGPDKVPVDDELKAVLQGLPEPGPIAPLQLFAYLARSPAGRRRFPPAELANVLKAAGVPEEAAPAPAPPRRLEALREFGRLLTDPATPLGPGADGLREKPLRGLLLQMLAPRFRNVLLVGSPGVGKTSLVSALAEKVRRRDSSVPAALHDLTLLELSSNFPLGDVSHDAQGQAHDAQRVRSFLRALEANPGVVVCADKFLPFLYLLYRVSLQQEVLTWFKHLIDNDIAGCIGSLHPQELPKLAELDPSLLRRFRVLHLEPPTGPELEGLVRARAARLKSHFHLEVPDALVPRAIALADLHLPERTQPEKTLRLLESACARAVLESAPALAEGHLLQAVEDFVGPVVLPGQPLGTDEVYRHLRETIVGQDDVLRKLAQAVVSGRADRGWFLRPGPRGVFLFGGPTGVGKTETALQLARLLSQGREALVRVDCQNLQGSGSGWEANTLTWRLLGVAPGYVGHVPGCRDGLLVRVRDFPECVLLFDEFEKADPAVGRLILRILDEGKAQDSEGHDLDFRRCFVILTCNAGVTYTEKDGFGFARRDGALPSASTEDLRRDLLGSGLGQEFLARIQHVFLFQGLRPEHLREIVERQLVQLGDFVRARHKTLSWSPAVVDHLAGKAKDQPNLGVRFALSLVRTGILDPLNAAVEAGELDDSVATIELLPPDGAGGGDRRREGDRLRLRVN
jgi:ATP-dependent Clp protease ATP-binding subunit ClpC